MFSDFSSVLNMKSFCLIVVLFLVGNASADQNNGSSTIEGTKKGYQYLIPLESKCYRPCKCNGLETNQTCAEGVTLIKDGCDCCYMCARQPGEKCDEEFRCDVNLQCNINTLRCEAIDHCYYKRKRLDIGQKINVNCGKNCTCLPSSKVSCTDICMKIRRQKNPLPGCRLPWYQKESSSCCGRWVCADEKRTEYIEKPQQCEPYATKWSNCTKSICGVGLSRRFEIGPDCGDSVGKRFCQIRTCAMAKLKAEKYMQCSTEIDKKVHLKSGSLRSVKRHKMKFCNNCPYLDCKPLKTATFVALFRRVRRRSHRGFNSSNTKTVVRRNVMQILECECSYSSTDSTFLVNRFPDDDRLPAGLRD